MGSIRWMWRGAVTSDYSHAIIKGFGKSLSGLMLISRRRMSYRQKFGTGMSALRPNNGLPKPVMIEWE